VPQAAHHDCVLILVCRLRPGAMRASHLIRHRANLRPCSAVPPSGHRAVHPGSGGFPQFWSVSLLKPTVNWTSRGVTRSARGDLSRDEPSEVGFVPR
jgi:hypothetical protein